MLLNAILSYQWNLLDSLLDAVVVSITEKEHSSADISSFYRSESVARTFYGLLNHAGVRGERDRNALRYAQHNVSIVAAYNRQAELKIGRAKLYRAII